MHRSIAAVALAAVASVVLTSCTFVVSLASGPDSWESLANGIDARLAGVEVRSFLIVSAEEGGPGRFLGTVFNESNEARSVVFSDEDESVTVSLKAHDSYHFSEHQDGLASVGVAPGDRLTMTLTIDHESEEIDPIILDGSLEQYRQYLPSDFSSIDEQRSIMSTNGAIP